MIEPSDDRDDDRADDRQSHQRISHAEREQVAEALQRAAGDGRLEVDELEVRLEATWSARTYLDLAPILADLPEQPPAPPGARTPATRQPPGVPAAHHATSVGVLSEQRRTGVWRVAAEHTATAVLGAVTLDLREAEFEARETTITANAVLGAVEVFVDSETAVVIDGTPVLGAFEPIDDKVPAELHEDSPVVRIRGLAVLGSVTVVRTSMPGEGKRRWL